MLVAQELVGDIHCIIEATIGRSADVALDKPNTDGVPKYVLGDPDRLRGILLNLYTNAAKFTKKGSIALRVRIAGRDYRPSPAQVKAQQQRGPNPVRSQGSNRQNGFEAGEQLLQQHRVLFSQDRNTPEGTASPFLSNALAIPHLSHTASAMRSQKSQEVRSLQAQRPSQSRPSQSRHRHRKDFELHNNASQVGQSAAGSEQGSHADRAEFHAQAMLLRGQQAHDCADQAMHVDNSVTTPASCEHIAGQAFLVSTAEKIAEAADTLRGGTCSRQLPGSKAQSQQAPHTQQPDGFLQDHASTPAEAEAVTVNNAIAIGVIKDGDHRFSSNCVLDEQPTSSSSSDDAMQSSGGHSTSREEEGGHSESYNSALSSKHQQQASANGFGEALQMPEALVDTRSCSPCGSGLGERSHSSADMTEHSHRQSSSSFSDCTQPMRRSVSSPGFNSSADDIASEPIKPNRPVTAAGYNGTASDKATLRGGVETSVQDLGNGWHNTVAQRKQPRPSASGRSNDAHPTAPNPNTLEPQSKSPFQAASAGMPAALTVHGIAGGCVHVQVECLCQLQVRSLCIALQACSSC